MGKREEELERWHRGGMQDPFTQPGYRERFQMWLWKRDHRTLARWMDPIVPSRW